MQASLNPGTSQASFIMLLLLAPELTCTLGQHVGKLYTPKCKRFKGVHSLKGQIHKQPAVSILPAASQIEVHDRMWDLLSFPQHHSLAVGTCISPCLAGRYVFFEYGKSFAPKKASNCMVQQL